MGDWFRDFFVPASGVGCWWFGGDSDIDNLPLLFGRTLFNIDEKAHFYDSTALRTPIMNKRRGIFNDR